MKNLITYLKRKMFENSFFDIPKFEKRYWDSENWKWSLESSVKYNHPRKTY